MYVHKYHNIHQSLHNNYKTENYKVQGYALILHFQETHVWFSPVLCSPLSMIVYGIFFKGELHSILNCTRLYMLPIISMPMC